MNEAENTVPADSTAVKKEAQRIRMQLWRAAHPKTPADREKDSEHARRYRRKNKAKVAAAAKARRPLTKERDAAQQKAWREKNAEHVQEYREKYEQENADFIRDLNAKRYARKRDQILQQKKDYYQKNKKRLQAEHKAYHAANPHVALEGSKRFQKTPKGKACAINHSHKRRAQKKNCPHPATTAEVRKFLAAQTHCAYCEKPFGPDLKVTLDHIVPLGEDPHQLDNFAGACQSCNSRKGKMSAEDFRKLLRC